MKEIQYKPLQSNYHHSAATEHRRTEWLEELNNTLTLALIAVGVIASMATGALLAVMSAAGML